MFSFLNAPICAPAAADFPLPQADVFVVLQGENQKRKCAILKLAQKAAKERVAEHRLFLHPTGAALPFALYIEEENLLLLDSHYAELPEISRVIRDRNAVYFSVDAFSDEALLSEFILALLFP